VKLLKLKLVQLIEELLRDLLLDLEVVRISSIVCERVSAT